MTHRLNLRNATDSDLEITYAITEDAMRGYVEQTWGNWVEREQRQKHKDNFTPKTHKIIEVENEVAGLVAIESFESYVWLVKLYLFTSYRDRGIGSQLLQAIIHDAKLQGKSVRLRVLRANVRARSLYEKLGFRVVNETAERFFMENVA